MDSRRATGACLSKINAFNLRVSLCNQSCLVPLNYSMLILLVLEYPLSAYNIAALLWLLNWLPHLVVLEVIELFMHCIQPIRIFNSFKDFLWFHHGYVCLMFTKVCTLSSSHNLALQVTNPQKDWGLPSTKTPATEK